MKTVSAPPTLGLRTLLKHASSKFESRTDLALNAMRELGDVVRMPTLGWKIFLVTHPADVKRVLIQNASNYRKSFDYKILSRLIGQGLITSEGEIWQTDRRLQHPLFHGKALDRFLGSVASCAEAMIEGWAPGQEIRLEAETARYAHHVIGERILSLDVRPWSEEIAHHLEICLKQINRKVVMMGDMGRWLPTPGELKFRKSLRAINRIMETLIEKRSKMAENPYDLYSILRDVPMSPKHLRDQVVTLFMAGHETSAMAIAWAFYCLSLRPEVDARVASESASVLQGKALTLEGIEGLDYTTQVINEVLRLYPPIAFVGREALADDELGGYRIPRGAIAVISPYATHRREDLWERPDEFDPSRFERGRRDAQPACSFIPFIAGPRGCIGQHLAMFEIQAAVSVISSRFRLRLTSDEPIRGIPFVSLRPSRPMVMRIERREAGAS